MAYKKWKPVTTYFVGDQKQKKDLVKAGKALGSETRIDIINILFDGPKTVYEIATKVNLPVSNVLFHLGILEDSGIVKIATYGKSKIVSLLVSNLEFFFSAKSPEKEPVPTSLEEYEIPIGNYMDIVVEEPPFLAYGENGRLALSTEDLFDPDRFSAGLFTFIKAQVFYRLKSFARAKAIAEISLSFEICSEVSFYRDDFKSEVSFQINGIELCSYVCPGDFGERRGRYNPKNYPMGITQYGQLVTITIGKKGVYLNGQLVNKLVNISNFKSGTLDFSISNKKDTLYPGGFNLFGKGFGDYDQGIKVVYSCL